MTEPNAIAHHGRDPAEIRAALEAGGWTLAEAAMLAGVSARLLVGYMGPSASTAKPMPYPLQFTLEAIAATPRPARAPRSTRGRKKAPGKPQPAERPPTQAPQPNEPDWRRRLSRLGRNDRQGGGGS